MAWWTEKKIDYYNRAARFTDFHRILASEIEKHISKDESIIEYGAGLGYVTEILRNDGYNIRAIEMDGNAIRSANERVGYELVEKGDAYGDIEKSDVILMCFFGRLAEDDNLDHFLEKTKKIVNISGRHKGYSLSHRKDHTGDLPKLLEERKIPFEVTELEAEFNQPFADVEEAREWFKLTYGRDGDIDVVESGIEEFPLTFVNRKRTVITVINTEKGEDNEE